MGNIEILKPNQSNRETANKLYNFVVNVGSIVTVFCSCTVSYDGRAKSELDLGDRMLLLKPDGTFLIHQDEKQKPVNWQPPGSNVEVEYEDNTVKIIGERTNPDETLTVTIEKFHLVTNYVVNDTAELDLSGTEEEMHNFILSNPQVIEPGLHNLKHERPLGSRNIDIFAYDTNENPVIIEVKRRKATPSHVDQLNGYKTEYTNKNDTESVRGVLVAPDITDGAEQKLNADKLEFVELHPIEK